jgi:hypothetical protein
MTAPIQIVNEASAGRMSPANIRVYSGVTSVDTYVVVDLMYCGRVTGHVDAITTTLNNLLCKVEATRDGITWFVLVEDFPCPKDVTTQIVYATVIRDVRVSFKPEVAGNHGEYVLQHTETEVSLDPAYRFAFAYEAKTVTSAVAVSLTPATFQDAVVAFITVENNPIRVRYDGTAPTSTEGHYLSPGDMIRLDLSLDLFHFKAIATSGDAKILVTYSR